MRAGARGAAGLLTAALAFTPVGCRTHRHAVTEPQPDSVAICARCYDAIRMARGSGGPRGGLAANKTVRVHACDDCGTEASIYTDGGVLKIRCARCAPEGLDCDLCFPGPAGPDP